MKIFRLLKGRAGSLMSAALIMPLLVIVVFATFDLAEKEVVRNAAAKAAREASRIYAQQENVQLARQKAEETFDGSVGVFGSLNSIQISQTSDGYGTYAVATVQASVRTGVFDFVWNLVGQKPADTISQTRVYMIEPKTGSSTSMY